jgi:hypothetical protein
MKRQANPQRSFAGAFALTLNERTHRAQENHTIGAAHQCLKGVGPQAISPSHPSHARADFQMNQKQQPASGGPAYAKRR